MNRSLLWLATLPLLAACDGPASAPIDASTPADAALDAPLAIDAHVPVEPRFEALAAAIEADLAASNATGASVAIWLDDEITWVGGFGTVDAEGIRRPGEQTLFMIGSDTKKIASILYLQEVAAGTATVESTIHDVLPDLVMMRAPELTGATAHELLSHQGGLVDDVGDFGATTTDAELRDYVFGALARQAYSLAPPGTFYNYSNPNFSIVGLMTETLAGRPWADLAEERVFAPLGMTRTVARKSEVDADHAIGFGQDGPMDTTIGPVPLDRTWESAFVRPAGLVWSTPSDQMRLARFLVDGDEAVLPDALVSRLHEPHAALYPDMPGHYGHGLFVSQGGRLGSGYHDVEVWYHGGNTLTHTSTFFVLPEQRFAISILSNGVGDDFTGSVVTAIRSLVTLPPPVAEPEIPFVPAALDGLVGTYVDPFNVGEVTVTRVGDALHLAMPALERAGVPYEPAMTHVSTRVWRASIQGQPLALAFFDGPDGTTYLVHRAFVAARPPAEASMRAGAPIGPSAPIRSGDYRAMPSRTTILATLRRAALERVPVAELAGHPQ